MPSSFRLSGMGYTGIPVTLTTIVLPIIIIPVVVADEIHIFVDFHLAAQNGGHDKKSVLRGIVVDFAQPIFKTGLTTSLSMRPIRMLTDPTDSDFGILACTANVFCTLWTLTALPALMRLGGVIVLPRSLPSSMVSLSGAHPSPSRLGSCITSHSCMLFHAHPRIRDSDWDPEFTGSRQLDVVFRSQQRTQTVNEEN